ncbi:MAG: hypothetical protein QOI78_8918, partial [Actinomycetota bacterium]|nr:hypothetical protein [Actinomycetota bacterium]
RKSVARIGWLFLGAAFLSMISFGLIDGSTSDDPWGTASPIVPLVAFLVISILIVLLTAHVAKFKKPV